ncbi:hypothetical protein PPERSA_10824 [Pseudocohnilembus persalinus]|uniref:UTP23 sensor motif region domain-containing protein n=1 Tax=Pseudocohnilembus persalinus TaxID=266149 RepID=A0A0V0QDU7_PSEPJ|nr:hypothetical protein PPERSA_10824 [Pseudocohnilembus persalinus]|eukprot:KRX00325.1 hypothetical protein PPERSA_10824 [Pseudocohnilembus persalinus]
MKEKCQNKRQNKQIQNTQALNQEKLNNKQNPLNNSSTSQSSLEDRSQFSEKTNQNILHLQNQNYFFENIIQLSSHRQQTDQDRTQQKLSIQRYCTQKKENIKLSDTDKQQYTHSNENQNSTINDIQIQNPLALQDGGNNFKQTPSEKDLDQHNYQSKNSMPQIMLNNSKKSLKSDTHLNKKPHNFLENQKQLQQKQDKNLQLSYNNNQNYSELSSRVNSPTQKILNNKNNLNETKFQSFQGLQNGAQNNGKKSPEMQQIKININDVSPYNISQQEKTPGQKNENKNDSRIDCDVCHKVKLVEQQFYYCVCNQKQPKLFNACSDCYKEKQELDLHLKSQFKDLQHLTKYECLETIKIMRKECKSNCQMGCLKFYLRLDGNFLKICIDRQMHLKDYLQKWLRGKIIIQVTSCVLQELNSLGPQFRKLFDEAKQVPCLKCGHISGLPANDCIKDLVANGNPNQYWICTQDSELTGELTKIPGIPIFFFLQDLKLDLLEPAKNIKREQELKEKQKYLPSKEEMKQILPLKQQQKEEMIQKRKKEFEKEKKLLGAALKKKAKAPNPLSMKKKQDKDYEFDDNQTVNSDGQKKRRRNRVRSKGQQKQQNQQNKLQQQQEENEQEE